MDAAENVASRSSAGEDEVNATMRGTVRAVAVLAVAALVTTLLPQVSASAAPLSWYRVGVGAGVSSYDQLAGGPGLQTFSTRVAHGGQTGTFRFDPRNTVSSPTGGPGQSAAGVGYATPSTLSGTIPAGTWTFDVTLDTTVPSSAGAVGRLLVAVYRVSPGGGSQLLGVVQDGRNVLASPGQRSYTLSASLPAMTFAGHHLATEWYLAVSANSAVAAGAVTSLRHGASGDTVTAPGPPAPPPLGAPSNLRVTAVGDNRIALGWSPASDGRVTGYVVRRSTGPSGPWADVATVGGTTFTDGGLNNGTRYYHTVVAVDGGGGRSTPSNASSAVPADTEPPPSPGDPTVNPNGSGRLDVVWPPSGAGDLSTYEVQRSGSSGGPFAAVARVGGNSFSDTGLAAASTWHYRVVAVDDDGLRSAPSPSSPGTVAPSPPQNLRVVGVASGAVALAWGGTSEPVVGYLIERAGSSGGSYAQVAGPIGGTSFTDSGLTNGATYWYRIRAVDSAGARSSPSGSVSAQPRDTGRPAPPTFLERFPRGNRVQLQWGASPSAVVGYRVLRSTSPSGGLADVSGLISGTSWTDGPLPVAVPFHYVVVAEDASGARSIESTKQRYTVPPSAPSGLVADQVNESSVRLRWNGTNEPIARWLVSRRDPGGSFTVVGRATSPSFTDGGLELGRSYVYVVQAEVSDGTLSNPSGELTVVPRDGPPTSPSGVQVTDTGAGGQLRIVWAANPERDVISYRVERNSGGGWERVATLGTSTYLDGGLRDGVTYRYRIVAVDRVGNVSEPSGETAGVPSDRAAPPAPAGVVVRAWPSYLDVAWSQAPGAAGYRVYRSTSPGGPFTPVTGVITSRTFRDTDVQRGVTYHYVVHALDAASNDSGPSQTVSATFTATAGGTTGGAVPGGGPTPGSGGPAGTPGAGTATPGGGRVFPGLTDGPQAGAPLGGRNLSGGPSGGTRATDSRAAGQPSDDPTGAPTPLALGDVQAAPDQPDLPAGSRADEALARGDVPRTIARSAEEVAENVGQVARVFRVPLLLLALLVAYVIAQGRLGRESLPPAAVDVPEGGEDDDLEYLL